MVVRFDAAEGEQIEGNAELGAHRSIEQPVDNTCDKGKRSALHQATAQRFEQRPFFDADTNIDIASCATGISPENVEEDHIAR